MSGSVSAPQFQVVIVLVIGPEGMKEKLLPNLQNFKPSHSLKILGLIFSTMSSVLIQKRSFYHLKNLARVHTFLAGRHAFNAC